MRESQQRDLKVGDFVILGNDPGRGEAWREGHVLRMNTDGLIQIGYGSRELPQCLWRLGVGGWIYPSCISEVYRRLPVIREYAPALDGIVLQVVKFADVEWVKIWEG